MQLANYQKHAKRQDVAVFEWVYLLNGKEPPHHWEDFRLRYVDSPDPTAPMFDELRETYKALKAGMDSKSKQLQYAVGPIPWYGLRRIEPSELLRWADAFKYVTLPDELRALMPAQCAPPQESSAERIKRLKVWITEERKKGRGWQRRVADREGIGVSRLKQILSKQPAATNDNPLGLWSGLATPKRSSTSRK